MNNTKCFLKLESRYDGYYLMRCTFGKTAAHRHTVPRITEAGYLDIDIDRIWSTNTVTATKTIPSREEVIALGRALQGEDWIVNLVRHSLNFFDLEGKKPEQVPAFNSLVQSAAYGVALMESKLEFGDTRPRPVRGPVIVCYNPINRTYDALMSYKAVKALGLKYKYSARSTS